MSGPFKAARHALLDRWGLLYTRRWYERSDRGKGDSPRVVADSLVERFAPRSVVDLGCGSGGFLAPLVAPQRLVLGLEKSRAGLALCAERGVSAIGFDLECDPLPSLRFDLCLCFEVAEHLRAGSARRLVRAASSLAPRCVFTAATPGQGGTGHVNEQPHDYWIDRFELCGARLDVESSEWLRARWAAGGVVPWLVANVMVFAAAEGQS